MLLFCWSESVCFPSYSSVSLILREMPWNGHERCFLFVWRRRRSPRKFLWRNTSHAKACRQFLTVCLFVQKLEHSERHFLWIFIYYPANTVTDRHFSLQHEVSSLSGKIVVILSRRWCRICWWLWHSLEQSGPESWIRLSCEWRVRKTRCKNEKKANSICFFKNKGGLLHHRLHTMISQEKMMMMENRHPPCDLITGDICSLASYSMLISLIYYSSRDSGCIPSGHVDYTSLQMESYVELEREREE